MSEGDWHAVSSLLLPDPSLPDSTFCARSRSWEMRVISPLLVILSAASSLTRALIITFPEAPITVSTITITYQSEAADDPGDLTFFFERLDSVGGRVNRLSNVVPQTTPTKLEMEISGNINDGAQWEILGAIPEKDDPPSSDPNSDILFISARSSAFVVQNSTSASASATGPSDPQSSASSPASPTSSVPAKTSASSGTSTTKSSLSVGVIVGIAVGTIVILLLFLFLGFLYLRRIRQRRRMDLETRPIIDREPVFMPHSGPLSTSHTGYSSTNESMAGQIQPFITTPSTPPVSTPSSKAAQVRQEYITNQMREAQMQLNAMQGIVGPASSMRSGSGSVSGSGFDGDRSGAGSEVDLQQARRQNEALQERIRALEGQLQSQWALGLSDEAPPGYLE
ncbi:hypothetical protein B0H13DRAFT_2119149 [Mycena leptocephala]|nr:hypothetical protein B0H13DRAFT_2119149 [Mycena leptocephala]